MDVIPPVDGNQAATNERHTMSSITIQLPTETSYWGSNATEADVVRINDTLETMLRGEFGERADLTFERTSTPRGSGIHGDDSELCEEIHEWLQERWTAAL